MSPLAIPSVPPAAAPGADTRSTPTPGGDSFDHTLKQSQSTPKPGSDERGAQQDTGAPARENRKADSGTQDDKRSGDDTGQPPGMAPIIVIAATPMRQAIAAGGATLPATGSQATGAATAMPPALPESVANPSTAGGPAPASRPSTSSVPVPSGASPASATPSLAGDADTHGADHGSEGWPAAHTAPDNPLAHLVQLAGTHAGTTPAHAPPPYQLAMQAAPGQPQFAQEAAQHVAWLAGQDIQRAEIQLNPRKLGPIQVEITTHHDRVDVSFAVQHPQTVHALQQTLPQLHDMLAQQGLNLGNASVGQQAHHQPRATPAYHADGDAAVAEADVPPVSRRMRIATPGRVDDFA